MYKITIQTLNSNETTIYYPGNADYTVISAVLTYEIGLAGEFNFAVPSTNPAYDLFVQNAIVTVYEDDKEIWRGDIRNIKTNFDKSLEVYVVEDLAWLGEEPVAMTSVTTQTYAQRFSAVIASYNSNQTTKRQFSVGQLTAQQSSGACTWQPEYGETVLSGLRNFIAKENGYLKVRRAYSGNTLTRYIDIVTLADYGKQSSQKIEFGSNLIDFVKDMDLTNLCNVLTPYGAETEESLYGDIMKRIEGTTIQNSASVAAYGRRAKAVTFDTDNVTTLNNLAASYLSRYSQPVFKIEAKAADLGSITNVDSFASGDSVRIVANVYAVDQWIYLTKLDVNLLDRSQNQLTLSDVVRKTSITNQVTEVTKVVDESRTPRSILDEAKRNAYAILTGENGGIVTFVKNNNDQIIELMIANNLDIEQATKAWRWNLNGLAYLHRTYASDPWTVGIAATMDGGIVADFINAGTLNANLVNVINLIATNITAGRLQDKYGYNFIDLDTTEVRLVGSSKLRFSNPDHSGAYVPTCANAPASGWNTVALNKANLGKIFKDTSTDKYYIYRVNPNHLPQSSHPTENNTNITYRVQTYLQAPIKIKFNANCELENNYDYLHLYYEQNGTSYKRTFTNTFGGTEVIIPTNTFWLEFTTDVSQNKWGWKIDSIEATAGNTSGGFSAGNHSNTYTDYYLHGWDEATIESYSQAVAYSEIEGISSEDFFNKLTNGGQDQGLYYFNGKVYVNGEYIKTGSLNANDIQAGFLTCNRINGGVLSLGGSNNEFGQIYIVGAAESVYGDTISAGGSVSHTFYTLYPIKVFIQVTSTSAPSGSASGTYTVGSYTGTLYANGQYIIGTFPAGVSVSYSINAAYNLTYTLYKAVATTVIDNTSINTQNITAAYINAISGLIGDLTLNNGELYYIGVKTMRTVTMIAKPYHSKKKTLSFIPSNWNITQSTFRVGINAEATSATELRTVVCYLYHKVNGSWVWVDDFTFRTSSDHTEYFDTNISRTDSSYWKIEIQIGSYSESTPYQQTYNILADSTRIVSVSARGFEGVLTGSFKGQANVTTLNDWAYTSNGLETEGYIVDSSDAYSASFVNYYGTGSFSLGSGVETANAYGVLKWLADQGRLLLRTNFSTSEDRGIIVSNYNPSDKDTSDYNAGGAYYTIIKATGINSYKNNSTYYSSLDNSRLYLENGTNYAQIQPNEVRVVNGSSSYSKLYGYALLDMQYTQRVQLCDSFLHFRFGDSSKYARLSADDSAEELTLQYNSSGRMFYVTANSDECTLRLCSSFPSKWMYMVSRPETQDIIKYDGVYTSVSWNTSDRRAKEDIEDLDVDLSLNLIDATETKRFKYKGQDGIHYGMIAQDARELLDNLGETDAALEHSMGITGPEAKMDDQRTIDYHEYTAHLINYVKFLRSEISDLKEEIRLLKEERNG